MKYPHTHILIPLTPDRRGRALEALASIQQNTNPEVTPYTVHLYENNYIGFPNAIRDMVEDLNGYAFMGASDLILGPQWLEILWEEFEKIGRNGAIEPYNEIQQGGLLQHPLIHTDLIKKYLSRAYFHYYADNEMHERMMMAGLYTYCPRAPMEHRHVVNKKAEMDEGYKVVFDPERNEKDRITFERRRANNYAEAD